MFFGCTPRGILDIYERNLQIIDARRRRLRISSPVLNVLQGRDFQEANEWFQVAKQYKLDGGSIGGGVGQAGGIPRCRQQLLVQSHVPLHRVGEVGLQRGLRLSGIAMPARPDDRQMLAQ
jgi:hypothetical protein